MQKIKKALRYTIIGCGWTFLYLMLIKFLMSYFWHFEIFELKYWKIISTFWQNGGVIDTASEYLFIFMLIAIIPVWIWGWKKANRLSYVKIIFFPVFWYHDYINRKYASAPTGRVILKNMGGGKNKKMSSQQMMEEMISSRMPQPTEKKDLNSSKIRSIFEQKNRNFQKKIESDDQ